MTQEDIRLIQPGTMLGFNYGSQYIVLEITTHNVVLWHTDNSRIFDVPFVALSNSVIKILVI